MILILVSKVSAGKSTQALTEKVLYEKYSPLGRLLQNRKKNGMPVSYIWGYNQQHIIAKVENATYTQIEALTSFGNGFEISNGLSPTQVNELRGLTNSFVTTYTYDPSVGVTAITDPRGYSYYYEYDNENRLQFVRDADLNIVTEYLYKLNNNNIPTDIIVTGGTTGGGNSPVDTDGDGWTDDIEQIFSTNVSDLCDFPYGSVSQDTTPSYTWENLDCDGDGVSNAEELINGTNPLIDDSGGGGGGGCNPPCPIPLQDYITTDRLANPQTGYDKLVAYIQLNSQDNFVDDATLSFSATTFGGSGNYEYRWRKKGEEFPTTYSSTSVYSLFYECGDVFDNRLGLICEVRDTTTGELFTMRWSNVISLECN